MTDDTAERRDHWISEAQARGQTIAELRASLKELIGHAVMSGSIYPPESNARQNIDAAIERAREALSRSNK